MAPRTQASLDLAQQIGRMAAALDRVAEDRKEFLAQIDKLDSSIAAMSGMLAEMRAAFGGMIRRTEVLEKDGERCEKLEARVGSLENWRANRRRTMTAIAAAAGAGGSALLQVILQLAGYVLAAHS
jgi:septal ring factor EnvC (AmiA/AmiB activator)